MRINLTTPHKITFTSPLNENSGFTQENYVAGSVMGKKPINMATIDEVHLNCDWLVGTIVNVTLECILVPFSPIGRPSFEIFKNSKSFLMEINKVLLHDATLF